MNTQVHLSQFVYLITQSAGRYCLAFGPYGQTVFLFKDLDGCSQVVQIVGADKILFGSDYPLLPQSRFLKEIESVDLPEEAKGLILSGNARRLLGIVGE